MNIVANFEHRAGSSRSKHEGESSFALCDRLSRTRDNSQRQLPTDHDYAVSTREYQTDQSSLNLPQLLLALSSRKSNYKNTYRLRRVDTVTPYQGDALIQDALLRRFTTPTRRALSRTEIEGVGYEYADLSEALTRYVPEHMAEGWNTMPDGEEVFYISTPSAGLWSTKAKLDSPARREMVTA